MNKLYVPGTATLHSIDIKQIIRIQSISNYSKLYFSDGSTLVVAKVLRWFEGKLSSIGFIRVHRTHLVNAGYIHHYRHTVEGRKLQLVNGEIIDVSKRKEAEFLKILRSGQSGNCIEITRKKNIA